MELLQLVAPVDCRHSARPRCMPRGYRSPDEAQLETFGPVVWPETEAWSVLRKWWLAHESGANRPNWDIAPSCEIDGSPGLILVEAKVNVPELSVAGKPTDVGVSSASAENHQRIGVAIGEACAASQRVSPSTAISRDAHYQLSNRVAFAWKLANAGVPTVLVYLGFWGDDGLADIGPSFQSAAHWEAVFTEYARSVVPMDLFEYRIECGAAPMWLLVRSRKVIAASAPRLSNHAMEPSAPAQ